MDDNVSTMFPLHLLTQTSEDSGDQIISSSLHNEPLWGEAAVNWTCQSDLVKAGSKDSLNTTTSHSEKTCLYLLISPLSVGVSLWAGDVLTDPEIS